MLKRIMVVLSGTPYTQTAIRHALELAQRFDAKVTGTAVLDSAGVARLERVPVMAPDLRLKTDVLKERVDAAVADFAEAAALAGVDHQVIREEGDPIDSLCRAWRYQDLTIVGLRGLFEYGVFSQPEDAVIRLITSGMRPVLAVSSDYTDVQRILIAYSGSLESAKAMKRFMQLNLWPDATIELVHFPCESSEYQRLLADAATYCMDWGRKVEVRAVAGEARDKLLDYATEQRADLIVMGDSAQSLMSRRVFGDTALHMIRNAGVPLFLSH